MLLWGSLALAILLGSAYYVMLSMPGHSYVGTLPPLSTAALTVRDHLTQHVQALAEKNGLSLDHRVPSRVKSICLRARLTLSTRTRTRSPRR